MALAKLVVMGISVFSAGQLLAATPSDRVEDRFENRLERQDDRIDQGVEAGRIGAKEAQALNRQQTSLDRAVDRQAADGGRLSVREAHRLENRFDRGSRAIRFAGVRPRG